MKDPNNIDGPISRFPINERLEQQLQSDASLWGGEPTDGVAARHRVRAANGDGSIDSNTRASINENAEDASQVCASVTRTAKSFRLIYWVTAAAAFVGLSLWAWECSSPTLSTRPTPVEHALIPNTFEPLQQELDAIRADASSLAAALIEPLRTELSGLLFDEHETLPR